MLNMFILTLNPCDARVYIGHTVEYQGVVDTDTLFLFSFIYECNTSNLIILNECKTRGIISRGLWDIMSTDKMSTDIMSNRQNVDRQIPTETDKMSNFFFQKINFPVFYFSSHLENSSKIVVL